MLEAVTIFVIAFRGQTLLSFYCTHTELSQKNDQRSGFIYTKTNISYHDLDGYSVSVQEIVNKTESTIKPQNLTLILTHVALADVFWTVLKTNSLFPSAIFAATLFQRFYFTLDFYKNRLT